MKKKIFQKLAEECKLNSEAEVIDYVTKREQQILKMHLENSKITAPGEKGGHPKYWMSKMNPKDRNHSHPIYGKDKEDLELKIIAYYLHVWDDKKATVRNILKKAVSDNETGLRTLQRFDKNLSELTKVPVSSLSEENIRRCLDRMVESGISQKEFNESVTCFNKIADFCAYEHIPVVDIRTIISVYRKIKLSGKHVFSMNIKPTKNLAFSRHEAMLIVNDALESRDQKSLAIALLITTGLRVGELLALEVTDINLKEKYLWIHQVEQTKTRKILPYVKENKPREVYLSAEALIVLNACLESRDQECRFLFSNPNAEDGKMHLRMIDHHLRTYVHKDVLGYGDEREPRSPHDCRRTYASLEYLNGTDIYTLRRQLGHSTIMQTEEYIKDISEAAERCDKLKGCGLLLEKPSKIVVYADYTQKKKAVKTL